MFFNNKFLFKQKYFLLITFFITSLSFAQTKGYLNVLDFGAKADGKTLNTKAIQRAIDQCYNNGGGTVNFPAGTFLTGTIQLKDNVILHLQGGSKILGSTNIKDYPMYLPLVPNNMDKDVYRALIRGENAKNFGITGSGIIDGQGKDLQINKIRESELAEIHKIYNDTTRYIPGKGDDQRPFLLRFVDCKGITIQGITLQYPAKWTQHYLNCDGITIRDVKVFAHGGANNDMVDIDGSKNVVITGMRGDSDDDGICLKSTGETIVENVLISDCIIRSRTNPIKTGTDSYGGFKNITINNCFIGPSVTKDGYSGRKEGLAGIALELVDGGILENVTISNITMEEMAAPIFIRLGNRGRTPKPNMESRHVGKVNNININNIVAKNAGRTGCSIIGETDYPITNISISNIKINFDGGGTLAEAEEEKPELVNEYPESIQLGNLPAYGFYIRHVDGITFRDVEFDYNKEDLRPAMLFDDVQNIKLLNFEAEIAKDTKAQVVLQKTSSVFVKECSPKSSNVFLSIEKNSKDINITGNNFSNISKPIHIDNTIRMKEIKVSPNLTGKSSLFEILQPSIHRDSLGMVKMYFPDFIDIFYTTDGTEPSKYSNRYWMSFEQIKPVTFKAMAVDKDQKSSIAVLKLEKLRVLSPQIFPKDQFFNKKIEVELRSNTKEASIYYSLDGSTPTKNSKKYTKPIRINKTTTLRTIAIKDGYINSGEAFSRYETIEEKKGVQYKYYDIKLEDLPNFMDLTLKKTGVVKKFSFEEIEHEKFNFALIMHGYLNVKTTGDYTFFIASNDGSKLLIDHKKIINNDGTHGLQEKSGTVHLSKGVHLVEVRYFQAGGVKSLRLSWAGSGFEKQEVLVK